MNTMIFDAHNFVKKLKSAGMPEEQAEVLASSQAALIEARLTYRLTIRMGTTVVLAVGVVATLVKVL